MTIYYSASKNAFYSSDVIATGSMPSDKVALTDSEYQNILTQQEQGYKITANTSTGKPQAVAQNLSECTRTTDALDSEVVHIAGSETITGTKTFSSSPIAPTPTAGDSSTKVATTAFVANLGNGKAPTNHASTATTYGIGTGSNYGHVKLSDSTNTTSAASAGVAATPTAVKAVNDAAVHKTGNETIAGTKTFTSDILTQHSITNAKNKSSADEFHSAMIFRDKQGQAFGHLQTASYADTGDILVKLSAVTGLRLANPDETTHYIGMGMKLDGTPYTTAPTPPANDDSTQIATTEWVGDNNAGSATKLKTARTFKTNLASTTAGSFDGSGNVTLGVTGTLPIGNGGTGLTASPSMLVNLASTTADTVLEASPRPGVTGILPVANGGTGSSSKNFVDLTSAQSIAGAKTFTGSIKAGVDALISHADDVSSLRIDGGSGWDKGASLLLYGKDEASYKGMAKIRVTDGTNTKELIVKPDGTLTWASKNVAVAGDYIPFSGSRGKIAGYETNGTNTTINASAPDSNQTGSAITVSNGTSGTSWTKIVRVTAAVTVTLGSSWKWQGGSAPTIVSGGILVCCWCGSGGIANFVSPS